MRRRGAAVEEQTEQRAKGRTRPDAFTGRGMRYNEQEGDAAMA